MHNETLAQLYHQLSCLERAGFAAQPAFGLLRVKDAKVNRNISKLQRHLKAGLSIAESGYLAGLFNEIDKELVHAAECSGKLATLYQTLAGYYGDKSRRWKKIKGQLYLPAFVLVAAVFIQPVPALVLGTISGQDYLSATVGQLVKFISLLYITCKLPFWLTTGCLRFLGLKGLVYWLQLELPLLSSWTINRQINRFLQILGLMLDAGLPIAEAFPKALATSKNPILIKRFYPATALLVGGLSLTEALSGCKEISRPILQLLLSGEKSGKLVETLMRLTRLEAEKIQIEDELLTEWIPRIVYFLISAWMAFSIIGSGLPVRQ